MKYSDYTYENIMSYPEYQKICNMFMELANDNETLEKLQSILYYGGHNNYSVSSNMMNKDNPFVERQKRISMAHLIINNPETFDFIEKYNIKLFHGTNARALPSILKNGICSVDESKENGYQISTGEEWSRTNGKRDFVSLTDTLDIAEGYSSIHPDDNELSFPVIFGTTTDSIKGLSKTKVGSEIPEIGINEKIPKESIKVIMVPSDKIDIVKQLTGNNIPVLAADNIENKFYYINDVGLIEIYEESYNELYKDSKQKTR